MDTIRLAVGVGVASILVAGAAFAAESGFTGSGSWSTAGPSQWQTTAPTAQTQYFAPRQRTRSWVELSTLYVVSTAYGVGMGVWVSSELPWHDDPGIMLIPPVVLGAAAPTGVYFLDQPRMPEGLPAAIAAGLVLGGGEGVGVAGLQYAFADERDEWGFKGLTRSTALGATAGGAAGYAIGYYLEPPPATLALTTSGAAWGMAVGTMVSYGGSKSGKNDYAALGGLIGYNVGMGGMAALGLAFVPKWYHIGWMWGGAAVGAAASLPVFLFYLDDDGPPMRRGFVFTGTAVTIGIGAGALMSGVLETAGAEPTSRVAGAGGVDGADSGDWLVVDGIAPLAAKDTFGLQMFGRLF